MRYSEAIIDLFPWDQGLGFASSEDWWRYVRSRPEQEKLELLILIALLSNDACTALLHLDERLLELFELEESTWKQLRRIQATSLTDFTQQLREWNLSLKTHPHKP